MKIITSIFLVLIATCGSLAAKDGVKLDCGAVVSASDAFGLDKPYDFTAVEYTPAPDGYEEFFVEHYGRHGSRYAYNARFYNSLHELLEAGRKEGALTPLGKRIDTEFHTHYKRYLDRMGDLSPLGRKQQTKIAGIMYEAFPGVFAAGDSIEVNACASLSSRSIMSMASFCLGLQAKAPWLTIEEENGRIFLNPTFPRDKHNPRSVVRFCPPFPYKESLDDFQDRKLDCNRILRKLVSDPDKVCKNIPDRRVLVRNIYVLVAGMESIPQEERTDFSGLFTEKEFALMWEVDNYQRFGEYFKYYPQCLPVVVDIMDDASRRICGGIKGGNFRFGHDHVMMPVLVLLGIDGHDLTPSINDELPLHVHTWDSCMATNVQMIFYRPKSGTGDILFKILLNGRESTMRLEPAVGCCYRWSDLQKYVSDLCDRYPVIQAS